MQFIGFRHNSLFRQKLFQRIIGQFLSVVIKNHHPQLGAGTAVTAGLGQSPVGHRARQVQGSGALSDEKITEYLIAEQTATAGVASAEASLETVLAVRDQVISAYKEIMAMPI